MQNRLVSSSLFTRNILSRRQRKRFD
jgi:hypothetical protein